jgi:hypothetical protein
MISASVKLSSVLQLKLRYRNWNLGRNISSMSFRKRNLCTITGVPTSSIEIRTEQHDYSEMENEIRNE